MHISKDTAWRAWRGAVRDRERAIKNADQAKDVYLIALFDAYAERRAEADAAGEDVKSKDAHERLGLPCVDCFEAFTPGHEVVEQETGRYRVFARCGRAAKEPV